MLELLLNLLKSLLGSQEKVSQKIEQGNPTLSGLSEPVLSTPTADPSKLAISQKGLELISQFEGLSLKPYLDAVNIPTIGYGSTFYEDGTKVTMGDSEITKERALLLLRNVVQKFEKSVTTSVKVPINQNQFDALMSLVYNIGTGNFNNSTLLKLLNANKYEEAANEFLKWNKAGGKVLAGLMNRRQKEMELFLTK